MAISSVTHPILPMGITELKREEVLVHEVLVDDKNDGYFGEVKRGSMDRLPCAVKQFHCRGASEEERVQMEQELQLMTAMKHPNLVLCYAICWDVHSVRPILFMELLNESLPQYLKRQEVVPYHCKVDICLDVARAVQYLHYNNIIHGDLTSSNVLIVGESKAKVTDYWMNKVRKYGNMKEFTEIDEKLPYMAPERIVDPNHLTMKSDTYSFGIIVSEIDTGMDSSFQTYSNLPEESPFCSIAKCCLDSEIENRPTFDEICTELQSKTDHNYKKSIEEFRSIKPTLQLQFASQLEDVTMGMLELKLKLHDKDAKLKQQQEMIDYLLKENDNLIHHFQSTESQHVEESVAPEEKFGCIAIDNLQLSGFHLGEGESSKVFKGRLHSRDIAFKRFFLHQNPPDKWLIKFQQESSLLGSLSHCNIIEMLGFTISPGNVGIVMELSSNTLYYSIFESEEVLKDTKKKRIIRQISSGMSYLHSQDIYHGKFSSYNVLVSEDGIYKLSNFGPKCAQKEFVSDYKMDSTSKSFIYSAPEILRGDILSYKSFQCSDVYSLAMVTYEVMSGSHCFLKNIKRKELTSMVVQHNARPNLQNCLAISSDCKELLTKSWNALLRVRPTANEYATKWNEINK